MENGLKEFLHQCIYRMDENSKRVNKCLDALSEEEVWKRPNASSNTIGNLIVHLCGNIRQYVMSSLGNSPDVRTRAEEFSMEKHLTKAELRNRLAGATEEAKQVMINVTYEELLRKRKVQGFDMSGIGILVHVTEHYSYHTGQVALLTKLWKNEDLGFYAGVNLDVTNEE